MEDYLGRNLVGEIESSKIIDEVSLFCNRPWNKKRYALQQSRWFASL